MIDTGPTSQILVKRIALAKWSVAALASMAIIIGIASFVEAFSSFRLPALMLVGLLCVMSAGAAVVLQTANARLRNYRTAEANVSQSLKATSSTALQRLMRILHDAAAEDRIIKALLAEHKSTLENRLQALWDQEKIKQRREDVSAKCAEVKRILTTRLNARLLASPAVRAKRAILDSIHQLKRLKRDANKQLDEKRKRLLLKWWFDLNRPRFEKVDARIKVLEETLRKLNNSGNIEKTEAAFRTLEERAGGRLRKIEQATLSAIPSKHQDWFDEDRILHRALLLSAFSIPVSLWRDYSQAGDVYESLRAVNGNYAGMTDADIWLETLTMSGPELAGLANLTKGALFEKYVATDTGGQLHEHPNHPDTDIVIDGVQYQIKATESEAYINQVSDHIPVISTSEVAGSTGSIDGGYTNEDLVETIDLALGGTVIDFSDTGLDAVVAGFGGVGIMAIIIGARSGLERYRKTGDAVDAALDAVGQTVKVTIRQGVHVAEIVTRSTLWLIRLVIPVSR